LSQDPKVSVIVLNWNGQQYLERCLSALAAQTYPSYEVILADNGSSDGSVAFVAERFPRVRIVQNGANLGFAAGNNAGIRASRGAYVATLNNDTQVEPGWLAALVAALESDPGVGLCASKMLRWGSEGLIDSAGVCVDVLGWAWDRRAGQRDEAGPAEREPLELFGACAGAALYRRAMLDQIGLFDPDFFIYLEDVDLAWRAQAAGWRCLYVPQAVVYHVHAGTVAEESPFKIRLLGRNKVWLLCKNYPFPPLLWYGPLILAYDLLAVVYSLLSGRGVQALLGRIEAWGKVPHMLAQRRRQVRALPWRVMMDRLAPLESPLAIARRYAVMRTAGQK
jgi:GT2 family glycosyltransferase